MPLLSLLLSLLLAAYAAAQPTADLAALSRRVLPSVVAVASKGRTEDLSRLYYVGSGYVVDRRGFIVTNAHVAQRALYLRAEGADPDLFLSEIQLSEGTVAPPADVYPGDKLDPAKVRMLAEVVAYDYDADLAIMRLHTASPWPHPPLELGGDETIAAGLPVAFFGAPDSESGRATAGVIGPRGRVLAISPAHPDVPLYIVRPVIRSGNSGGPVVDPASGLVLGTACGRFNDQDGYFIGADRTRRFLRLSAGAMNAVNARVNAAYVARVRARFVAEIERRSAARRELEQVLENEGTQD